AWRRSHKTPAVAAVVVVATGLAVLVGCAAAGAFTHRSAHDRPHTSASPWWHHRPHYPTHHPSSSTSAPRTTASSSPTSHPTSPASTTAPSTAPTSTTPPPTPTSTPPPPQPTTAPAAVYAPGQAMQAANTGYAGDGLTAADLTPVSGSVTYGTTFN